MLEQRGKVWIKWVNIITLWYTGCNTTKTRSNRSLYVLNNTNWLISCLKKTMSDLDSREMHILCRVYDVQSCVMQTYMADFYAWLRYVTKDLLCTINTYLCKGCVYIRHTHYFIICCVCTQLKCRMS